MLRYLPVILVVGLTIYALIDCIQTPDAQVRNLPKWAWLILILLFDVIGSIAWFFAGRPSADARYRSQQGRWNTDAPRRGRKADPPRGPDDDPDFLRKL
ncbi:MAG: PLD nuclease N-terminal domain-containing protein [Nostocoides sp.]